MLSAIDGYAHIADLPLTAGVHTFALGYPGADLTPGNAEKELTTLTAIALVPADSPKSALVTLPPRSAHALCGRQLDWIEIVRGA